MQMRAVRGFTLIEILVVLTISAILVAMSIPMFDGLIRSNRISSATNSFVASMDLARSEAVRRNGLVAVCRSVNADSANPTCSNAAVGNFAADDWATGWIVFAVAPANASAPWGVLKAGDEVISQQAPLMPPQAGERVVALSTINAQARIFDARGLTPPSMNGAIGMTVVFDFRDPQVATPTNAGRCAAMNISGRVRINRMVNNACPAA